MPHTAGEERSISKTLVTETKSFLPAADFHGQKLSILVKMYTAGKKFLKIPLEILMTFFSFQDFNVLYQIKEKAAGWV